MLESPRVHQVRPTGITGRAIGPVPLSPPMDVFSTTPVLTIRPGWCDQVVAVLRPRCRIAGSVGRLEPGGSLEDVIRAGPFVSEPERAPRVRGLRHARPSGTWLRRPLHDDIDRVRELGTQLRVKAIGLSAANDN